MIIAVAGPYSASTEREKKENLDKLNQVAAQLLKMGHIPLIGINAALPVTAMAEIEDVYEANMAISMAVISAAEALLITRESEGANRERDWMLRQGRPVYTRLEQVPAATN